MDILLKKVYDKYGHLIKKPKLSSSVNSIYSQDKEKNKINKDIKLTDLNNSNNEEIDFDLLSDPDLMIRKFKELEEKILRIVERKKMFNKYEIKEAEDNKQLLREMKSRIIELQKEYDLSKKALIDYKINEIGKKPEISEEDFCSMTDDLCKAIHQ